MAGCPAFDFCFWIALFHASSCQLLIYFKNSGNLLFLLEGTSVLLWPHYSFGVGAFLYTPIPDTVAILCHLPMTYHKHLQGRAWWKCHTAKSFRYPNQRQTLALGWKTLGMSHNLSDFSWPKLYPALWHIPCSLSFLLCFTFYLTHWCFLDSWTK